MTSEFLTEFEAIGFEDLMSFHGQEVTRWPLNVQDDAETVSQAIWVENEPVPEKTQGAKQNLRSGMLLVPDTQTVDRRDTWFINSEKWTTKAFGRKQAGFQSVALERRSGGIHRGSD